MKPTEYYLLLALARLLMFVLLALIVYLFALIFSSKSLRRKRPFGVTLLAVLLAAASIDKLIGFQSFAFYQLMFQQLSDAQILFRYALSLSLRLAGLLTAVGLLSMRETFRRLVIGLAALTLLTQYWKHPLYVFQNLANSIDKQIPAGPAVDPIWALAFYVALDCAFALSLVIYFTRPKVKNAFRR